MRSLRCRTKLVDVPRDSDLKHRAQYWQTLTAAAYLQAAWWCDDCRRRSVSLFESLAFALLLAVAC